MHRLSLLSILVLTQIYSIQTYTAYSSQQAKQITQRQLVQWEAISTNFHPGQLVSFLLQRREMFLLKSMNQLQIIKMRGRAYFLNDNRKFVEIKQLSPFDVTKIYIYSETGIIVKSEEFYERFALQLPVEHNQLYRVMFADGPPGPLKIIQWQLDSEYLLNSKSSTIPGGTDTTEVKILPSRLNSISEFIQQGMQYTWLSIIQQEKVSQYFLNDTQFYTKYIVFQAGFTLLVCIWQVFVLKRLFEKNVIVLV